MEYAINKLSRMAGVSARTLRYYDGIGLLKPARLNSSGYRIYGRAQVERLQQIMFYRELGFGLEEIKRIIDGPGFNRLTALENHLTALRKEKRQLETLIANVEKTILTEKGEIMMEDEERFEGFKKKMVEENDREYGKEIRGRYGNETVDRSNAKVMGMSKEQYAEVEKLSAALSETLKAAFEHGDPAGELAQKACELHKQWLMYFWDGYSREAHMGLGQMYVDDERFTAHYDKIAPGCAEFFRDAIMVYCK